MPARSMFPARAPSATLAPPSATASSAASGATFAHPARDFAAPPLLMTAILHGPKATPARAELSARAMRAFRGRRTARAHRVAHGTQSSTHVSVRDYVIDDVICSRDLAIQCAATTVDNAVWPATDSGQISQGVCVAGYTGSPSRLCTSSGTFSPTVTSPCTRTHIVSDWLALIFLFRYYLSRDDCWRRLVQCDDCRHDRRWPMR